MHVLHLIKTSDGAAWALNLIRGLKAHRDDVTFSVILPHGGRYFDDYKEVCTHVYAFDFQLGRSLYRNGQQFKDLVRHDRPDVIHSWFTQTTLYARLFLRDSEIPRIFQVVGPAHLELPLFAAGDILSGQQTDYWVATSKYIKDRYLGLGINKEKIFLNYPLVDIERLTRVEDEVEPINYRKELNLPIETKIIGTASYIYPPKFYERFGVKGHEYLLRAFEELLKRRSDVALVIAGTTFGGNRSYEIDLKSKAKSIAPERIFFTGSYTNAYATIHGFDVFVYLSLSENLGGVYESLLYQIPTVSSNRGALPELVIDGLTGYCVNPEESTKVADSIERFLDDDSSDIHLKGRDLVKKLFDSETIVRRAFEIYESVILLNSE